ncbi:MAG: hypothetical protein ABIJ26_02575, partial [Candidatus Margulisiibacteriota bacterium]
PKGATKAKVVFGLYECTGTAYFDDIQLKEVPPQSVSDPDNLLIGGNFDIWEGWAFGGTEMWGIVWPAKEGIGALWVKNEKPIWSFATQSVPLDGGKVNKIKISGYIKANNIVPGDKNWQKARINLEFKDNKGKRIGGWPIVTEFEGTFEWKYVEKTFAVPADTSRVDVFCGLLECKGEAWFDGVKMEAYDAAGKKIRRGGTYRTNTSGWNKFFPPKTSKPGSVSDVSFLLDAPAGKHGFLKVNNGHFYFEDGSRVRFWGTNIYAPHTFPSKKDAEMMAERLARGGCNLVRIHHIDAFWSDPNIFDKNFNDTQHFSAESLDRLDYLIYQLKQRGIYVFMDLLVDRTFKEGDNVVDYQNVERGAKFTGFYDKRIIELQKKYAADLLTHYNPYTKLSYENDPVIVSAKLINEATMFYMGTKFDLSEVYKKELDDLWNSWLISKYGGRDGLNRAWTDKYGRADLKADEDPRLGNVRRGETLLSYQRSGSEKIEPLREADTMRFYYDLQNEYFADMEKYLKSIGIRVPISGSNHWVNIWADVKSNARLDYIDRHRYWDHPQLSYGTNVLFEDQPMVKNPKDALPNNFAYYNVNGEPFVVSEWNCCFPNEFRIEGPIIMAAYANLQDWDGVLQFSFNQPGYNAPMEDNFNISAWPNVWAQWPAAAMLFYRGDVSKAKNTYERVFSDSEIFGPIKEDNPIADEPLLPLITRTVINFGPKKIIPDTSYFLDKFLDRGNKVINSDTGQLKWNYGDGIFTVNTPKTQGSIGFTGGKWIDLSSVKIYAETPFSSIMITSYDNQPLVKSKRVLVTCGARIENFGQVYNETRTQLVEVGKAPILVEPVEGKIFFKDRTPKKVTGLDIAGNPVGSAQLIKNGFAISKDSKAFFYDVSF